jgi:RNA polymerase sigma-70 factor (ECF subfamily)
MPFTSRAAIKAINLSALGFLGFLSALAAIPGLPPTVARWCLGMSGFFGFFGLVGVAFLLEMTARRKKAKPSTAERGQTSSAGKRWIIASRWTARVLGTVLLLFYGVFVVAEGLPPIALQPEGVQLNFIALALLLLGFIVGWKREGAAALLIASGWTVWQISESRMEWNLFQTPLPVAALYAACWWATHGRKTARAVTATAIFAVVLFVGRLICPANVFVGGVVSNAASGDPVTNAELRLLPRPAHPARGSDAPNTRSDRTGRFRLYVSWYAPGKEVAIDAPGFTTLKTNLGPRPLGARGLRLNFKLQPSAAAEAPPVVIQTVPESGATNVDPELTELRATFSKPMQPGSPSWVFWSNDHPKMAGPARYLADERTSVLPVRLEPGKTYAIWLNHETERYFKGRDGQLALPYLLIFETRK